MLREEDAFEPDTVIMQNISLLEKEQSLLEERRICELASLAHSAAEYLSALNFGGMPIVDAFSLLFSDGKKRADLHPEALSMSVPHLREHGRLLSMLDRAVLVSLLRDCVRGLRLCPTEADFLPPSAAPETFTYVKNFYADEAYDVFSESFSDPRVFYSDTLKEAISAVEDGKAGYCLVPLEEKGGVRLAGVSEMLFRSDLRIVSVTPVYGYGEENDLTYALISRGFRIPAVESDDDRYLELRLPKEGTDLSELLFAAAVFGAEVYRIHSLRMEAVGGAREFYSLVFRTEGKDFVSLLIYLSVFVKEFTPIGIYASLES